MNDGCYGSKRDLVAASSDTRRFYELLDALAAKHGGPRNLAVASGRMAWPHRGVYFFFEPGEARVGGGAGQRVVRVGTHALKAGAQSSRGAPVSTSRITRRRKSSRVGIQPASRARPPGARSALGGRFLEQRIFRAAGRHRGRAFARSDGQLDNRANAGALPPD
jgi:hypothetical protein